MDDLPNIPISLPAPPNAGVILRPPPSTPSIRVRLPPAPLPAGHTSGGRLATISPHKQDRTNYPIGQFSKRSKPQNGGAQTKRLRSGDTGSSREEDEDEALSYPEYLEYIQSGEIGFFRLKGDIYVVQGWDGRRKVAKVRFNFAVTLRSLLSSTGVEQMVPFASF
jgi:hypothetical protein